MQTQPKFCLCFTKVNIKILSATLMLPLISSVDPSPNTKKLFLQISICSIKCYSIATKHIRVVLIFMILVAPNKQFLIENS